MSDGDLGTGYAEKLTEAQMPVFFNLKREGKSPCKVLWLIAFIVRLALSLDLV